MKKLDRIKTIVAVILIGIPIGSFVILGKDHDITRWSAASAIVLWIIVMFWFNRLKKT